MHSEIRALDFSDIERQVRRALNPTTGEFRDPLVNDVISQATTTAKAVGALLYGLVPPLGRHYPDPSEIGADSRIAEALIRTQRHPEAPPLTHAYMDILEKARDAKPRLDEIAAARPDWQWDLRAVRQALQGFLRNDLGRRTVNPHQMPWRMGWGDAGGIFRAYMLAIVFEELDLLR